MTFVSRLTLLSSIPECPDDAVSEAETFGRVAGFRRVNAVIEILDAVVKFKRENLHARFEIHCQVFIEMDELRLAFFVDCAIIAIVKPLEIDTDTHTKSIFDKSVLPMDAAFVIKRRRVDELGARDFLPTF